MDDSRQLQLRDALDRLNRSFYEDRAVDFSATRQRPWPGWRRVAELAHEQIASSPRRADHRLRRADDRMLRVVDLACGNARFADGLAEKFAAERWSYLGVERSVALLDLARQRLARLQIDGALCAADLILERWPLTIATDRSDVADGRSPPPTLCVAFGILHHVPTESGRRRFLERLATTARPGDLVALSFWQFERVESIRRRALEPELLVQQRLLTREQLAMLEPGDAFLPWGELSQTAEGALPPLRFCHSANDAEIERLLAGAFPSRLWERVSRFHADGRTGALNAYAMLERRA